MKNMCRVLIPVFCLSLPPSAKAVDFANDSPKEYIKNLGSFLGFNIQQAPGGENSKDYLATYTLIQATVNMTPITLLKTVIGALPPNSSPLFSNDWSQFNNYANNVFLNYASSTSAGSNTTLTVSPLIDEPNYQQDPISQSIMNILNTPDYSYCSNNQNAATRCPPMVPPQQALLNIIGELPDNIDGFFNQNGGLSAKVVPELNINTLLGPLLYSTEKSNTNNKNSKTLSAATQVEQAGNFVRYVSSQVVPIQVPSKNDLTKVFQQTRMGKGIAASNTPSISELQAETTLANYFANLRVYAAQTSVGMGNLYQILAKRMPQNIKDEKGTPTSQALKEFQMASWRILNPNVDTQQQWANQLNNASPATVQKEIATLLAEINHQLYLNRMQDERLLLTQSILLLQNARAAQPDPNLANNSNEP